MIGINNKLGKIIVILGPTASGKSDVAIKLAKKYNGEIISADSRQVYRHMNIGTGKVPLDPSPPQTRFDSARRAGRGIKGEGLIKKVYYSAGIPHYMIDIVSPKTDYNVAKFKKEADKIIKDILSRGKLPIICGGTGFWIKAIVDNVQFPNVLPDKKLRKKLEKLACAKLIEILRNSDSQRAKSIDKYNKVRLIRAIEVAKTLGRVPGIKYNVSSIKYNALQTGISILKEKLYKNIKKRLEARFKQGMIKEVKDLHNPPAGGGLSWKKIQSFGLGYYWIPLHLRGTINKKELFEKIYQSEKDYAKRQMTWFRKDKRIKWLGNYQDIEKRVKFFIKN